MSNLFKIGVLTCVGLVTQLSFANEEGQIFEQSLGHPFNTELMYQDLSKSFSTSDGTLTYIYSPTKKFKMPFTHHSAYLTPTSKLVAIIEATKIEESEADCSSTFRYFSDELAGELFGNYKTLDKLKEMGYVMTDIDNESPIQVRHDPRKNLTLQFGCLPSGSEVGKFAFIASFSANLLKDVAKKEHDQLIATNPQKKD